MAEDASRLAVSLKVSGGTTSGAPSDDANGYAVDEERIEGAQDLSKPAALPCEDDVPKETPVAGPPEEPAKTAATNRRLLNTSNGDDAAPYEEPSASRRSEATYLLTKSASKCSSGDGANTRAKTLANKVSTLLDVAAESEDGLQLADAEAFLAARKGAALRADLERTARLHEDDLARAEAAWDGDLADRDEAIRSLETELAGSKTAEN
ncbi:hypothetical protein THAOC_20764, partial [Thalassiosira oceanica]